MSKYLSDDDCWESEYSERHASKIFVSDTRDTGEPYVTHLRATTMHLIVDVINSGMTVTIDLVRVALFHDLLEDHRGKRWFIKFAAQYGLKQSVGIWWVTKPSTIFFFGSKQLRDKYFNFKLSLAPKKYFMVKMADRIHNLRDLWPHLHDEKYQYRKAKETLWVYIPISESKGMSLHYLKNLAMQIIDDSNNGLSHFGA